GNAVEYKYASDPSELQTYSFTFSNSAKITSLDVAFINDLKTATADRNLYIRDITVNDHHLEMADGANKGVPGTWNLYGNGSIHYDMTSHQDLFVGASTDNDRINGGGGSDVLNGGAGHDTFVFDQAALTDARLSTPVLSRITDYDQGNSG